MRRLIACLILLFVTACATTVEPPLKLPQPRLSPLAMGVTVSLTQRLTIERAPDGRSVGTRSLDALLEIDPTVVRMAAFALGQRVLTLVWDGTSLNSERHPLLPVEVDPAFVLRDVQWMYAPVESLRGILPAGWELNEEGNQRTLRRGTTPVLLIRYGSESRWSGRSRMENRLEGYSLTIESSQEAGG